MLKAAGKRGSALEKTPYTLQGKAETLQQLIGCIVRQEVALYNGRGTGNMLVPFLTEAEVSIGGAGGKVGFGRIYPDKKVSEADSVEAALQGFEDGLFKVVVDDNEVKGLNGPLDIRDGSEVVFLRLAFLSGRLW